MRRARVNTPSVFSSMRVLRFASISMDKATKCLLWLRIAVVVFLVIAWALVAGEKGFEKVDGLLTGLIFAVFGSVIAAASGAFFFSRFSQQVSLLVWVAAAIITSLLALVAGVLFASKASSCLLANAAEFTQMACPKSAKIVTASIFSLLACFLSAVETVIMISLLQDFHNDPKQV